MLTEAYSRERHKAEFHRRRMGDEPLHVLALHTEMPAHIGDHEVTAPIYKRKTIPRTDGPGGGWKIAKNGDVSNLLPIIFSMQAKERFTVKYLSISAAGNLQRVVKLSAEIEIAPNPGLSQEIRFQPGDLVIADAIISSAASTREGERTYAQARSVFVPSGE